MSEYVNNFDLDFFTAPNEETFDFSYLDYPAPIGQNEVSAYDFNAGYDFGPDVGLGVNPVPDFAVPVAPDGEASNPSFLDNPGSIGHYEPAAGYQPGPSLPVPPGATATAGQL